MRQPLSTPIRRIYTGDNLPILRSMNSETVDLIYLDPPFNSKKWYVGPLKIGGKDAIMQFKDVWTLDDIHSDEAFALGQMHPETLPLIDSLTLINGDSWRAYLIYMGIRLMEMRRILKPTGSIYYHCDPTMSHGIKLLMDAVFGGDSGAKGGGNFRNEIVWRKTNSPKSQSAAYGKQHDIILYYSKSGRFTFNKVHASPDDKYLKSFRHSDDRGRYQTVALVTGDSQRTPKRKSFDFKGIVAPWLYKIETLEQFWNEGRIHKTPSGFRLKDYLEDGKGKIISGLWTDDGVKPLQGKDKQNTKYKTQKPEALLRRIISASSNPGDLVLDPFCGCATACYAAEDLNRWWIGIDMSEEVAALIVDRLKKDKAERLLAAAGEVEHLRKLPKRTDLQGLFSGNDVLRPRLYKLQNKICPLCEEAMDNIRETDIDHIIPVALGGQTVDENLQLLHGRCNREKGAKTMTPARKRMLEKRTQERMAEWDEKRKRKLQAL